MNTASCKAKGRKLQKWVCARLADIFNTEYDQQDDNCAIHSREMGQSGTDVILRGDLFDKFPFDIECKNTEKLSLWNTIEQAKNNTKPDRDWLIVHKKNYENPVVIIDWFAFEKLFRKLL